MSTATAVRERPILMRPDLVRAAMDDQKTQTRRIVKPQPFPGHGLQPMWGRSPGPNPVAFGEPGLWREVGADYPDDASDDRRCPYGVPGDRFWVRETWALVPRTAFRCSEGVQQTLRPGDDHDAAVYRADWTRSNPSRWRPSIHMPRWASRLTLEITGVRVERLCSISRADCVQEGLAPTMRNDSEQDIRVRFRETWDAINGKRAPWSANPWVWVLGFRRIEP